MKKINRDKFLGQIKKALLFSKIVCLLGPRQSGKTSLAKDIIETKDYPTVHYFDLENPIDMKKISKDLALENLKGLVIIDEIQRKKELLHYLKHLNDENLEQKFLILGSASTELIQKAFQKLHGRVKFIEITPFSLYEVEDLERLWAYGGMPKSYLSNWNEAMNWLNTYMKTYLFNELSYEEFNRVSKKIWKLLANSHAQIINYSKLATDLRLKENTLRNYISFLEDSFVLRLLEPWHENLTKSQVKNPKVYYRDSGLLHCALGMQSPSDVIKYSKIGASFEGFAVEAIIMANSGNLNKFYFWGLENKAELDLLMISSDKKIGFEFKMSNEPTMTKSMHIAIETLKLDSLIVIYPQGKSYILPNKVTVISLEEYLKSLTN